MKTKRILALILSVMMIFTIIPQISFASDPTKFGNFKTVKTYTYGQFEDVNTDDWFSENVKSVYVFGLMVGRSETEFAPNENMTVAEAMTIAARLNAIYQTGEANFEKSEPWYKVYTDYCKANGIADIANYDPNALVTRGQFAEIFANALPEDALGQINNITNGAVPDVNEFGNFGRAVYSLYRAGILVGNDELRTFAPNSYIKRNESAAITGRMAVPSQRKKISVAGTSSKKSGSLWSGRIISGSSNTQTEEPELKTIAEVLATVPNFPISTAWDVPATNSWTSPDGFMCCELKENIPEIGASDSIAFYASDTYPIMFSMSTNAPVTKFGNSYVFTWDDRKITFNMLGGKLVAVSVLGLTDEQAVFNGKTFTAPTGSTKTLAEILATNSDFPKSADSTPPANSWVNKENAKDVAFISDIAGGFIILKNLDSNSSQFIQMTEKATKVGSNYVLEDSAKKVTFYMEGGKITSFKFESKQTAYDIYAGTYAPAEENVTAAEALVTGAKYAITYTLPNGSQIKTTFVMTEEDGFELESHKLVEDGQDAAGEAWSYANDSGEILFSYSNDAAGDYGSITINTEDNTYYQDEEGSGIGYVGFEVQPAGKTGFKPVSLTKGEKPVLLGDLVHTLNGEFPATTSDDAAEDAWVNANGQKLYEYGFMGTYELFAGDISLYNYRDMKAEETDEGVYSYTDEEGGYTLIFTMEDGVLASIEVKNSTSSDGTYAPAAPETITLAELMATQEGFPTSEDNAWVDTTDSGKKMWLSDGDLSCANTTWVDSDSSLTKIDGGYEYEYNILVSYKVTFNMDGDTLTSIELSGTTASASGAAGTYAPAE